MLLLMPLVLASCRNSKPSHADAPPEAAMSAKEIDTSGLAVAGDSRLQIQIEITDEVKMERIPMRTARLHFKNLTQQPLRIYLPAPDAFRWGISSIVMKPSNGPPLLVPTPRPHGYVISEKDFHLLAPGESRVFTQSFSLDPMQRGAGTATARLPGFEAGAKVAVRWTYENASRRWAGGVQTLDGPTRTLFDGGDIPHIWTGKLNVETQWTVP